MVQKRQVGDALQACSTSLKWGKEATPLRPEQQAQERSEQGTPLTTAASQILPDKQIQLAVSSVVKLLLLTVNVLGFVHEQA